MSVLINIDENKAAKDRFDMLQRFNGQKTNDLAKATHSLVHEKGQSSPVEPAALSIYDRPTWMLSEC